MFIMVTKEDVKRRRKELDKIVRILDDVDWVYGEGAELHVKRHERSDWAARQLARQEEADRAALERGCVRIELVHKSGGKSFISDQSLIEAVLKVLKDEVDRKLSRTDFKKMDGLPSFLKARFGELSEDSTLRLSLDWDVSDDGTNEREVDAFAPGEVTLNDIMIDFVKITREKGVVFGELVKKYVNERFDGNQARTAREANLDPQVLNRIYKAWKNPDLTSERPTVIALAFAFRLNIDEANEFLNAAGFSFRDTDEDKLFRLCFKRGFYRITEINNVLWQMRKNCIGTVHRGCERRQSGGK